MIATNARTRAAGEGSADIGCSGEPCGLDTADIVGVQRLLTPVESRVVRVTVVVPTFNEADNLDALVRGVRDALPEATVLVVDDNSSDGTADLAVRLGCELGGVDVLRRPRKAGLGAAYRAGFRLAIDDGAEILVQMDADLSHDPGALPALVGIVAYG